MGVNNLTFGAVLEQEIYKLCCNVNFYFFLVVVLHVLPPKVMMVKSVFSKTSILPLMMDNTKVTDILLGPLEAREATVFNFLYKDIIWKSLGLRG